MTKTASTLCVAVVEHTAFIKVPGRANYASSIDLKNLVGELRQRGFSEFVLDLRECITMDSTFLGVLAGLVLRNSHPEPAAPSIELLNPNSRVLDLVENLGVLNMFKVTNDPAPLTLCFEPAADHAEPSKEEVTRNCLDAHRTLMKLNPDNVPKFKEVTQFMAEDLKKMANGK
jgi:anti-anti-sigma regulatory factor